MARKWTLSSCLYSSYLISFPHSLSLPSHSLDYYGLLRCSTTRCVPVFLSSLFVFVIVARRHSDMPLTDAQRQKCALHFLLLDRDSDGLLPLSELGELMRAVGLYLTDAEVEGLKELVDADGTGSVSKDRALAVMDSVYDQRTTMEELREAFKVLDENGDGYLTSAELRHIIVNLGMKLSHDEADAIIADVEKDDENQISIDDLVTLLITSHPILS